MSPETKTAYRHAIGETKLVCRYEGCSVTRDETGGAIRAVWRPHCRAAGTARTRGWEDQGRAHDHIRGEIRPAAWPRLR